MLVERQQNADRDDQSPPHTAPTHSNDVAGCCVEGDTVTLDGTQVTQTLIQQYVDLHVATVGSKTPHW